MEWVKKHTDTIIVLGGILTSVMWMNHKFNRVDEKFSILEKEVAIIKTVLIIKGIMPDTMASKNIPQIKEQECN